MKILEKYCEAAVSSLNAEYDKSKVVKHSATSGAIREGQIKDLLEKHLPSLVHVVSGQVFDSNDNYSKQQDIVLVHKSMPRLQFDSNLDLIFIEGVVATVEIKTHVSPSTMQSIGDNFRSVRALTTSVTSQSALSVNPNYSRSHILCALVTFTGAKFPSMQTVVSDLASGEKPDLLLDLSKGLLVINNGTILPKDPNFDDYIEIKGASKGLARFILILTEVTGALISRQVNWGSYC
ncbi:DUF6602 domain-containing protein [Vibrio parahaemolyticus]|uniref:DUF6602 domain-containing protein n=2 Tax=Vibrio parahaemolyticus TaxID=670 RepID=UPI0004121AD5|nr:DUF6602 domain-containing protein [Vibrio parahaemolyticus]KJR14361.1 hypothetical protein UF28_18375 [Vibrio parahaemolyticus]